MSFVQAIDVAKANGALTGTGLAPSIMSSAPTVLQSGAGGTPSLAKSYLNDSAAMLYPNSRTALVNGYNVVANATPTNGAANGGTGWKVMFATDAPVFELRMQSAGGTGAYNVLVDGQYVNDPTSYKTIAAGGSNHIDKYTFAARANRVITVEMNSSVRFGGVYVSILDTVWLPAISPVKMAILGDSFAEGSTSQVPCAGYGFQLGRFLGIDRCWVSGVGATGFVANAGATKQTFVQRLATDITSIAADIVFAPTSINDSGLDIASAAATIFGGIRASSPDALIVTSGPINMHGSNAAYVTLMNAAFAALTAVGGRILLIDNLTSPDNWTAGAGNTGATAGTGNADVYCDTDGTHANTAGHVYLGQRLHARIRAALTS